MVAIFVVLTILVCLAVDVVLEKRRAFQNAAKQAANLGAKTWILPERTHLHPGHTWAELGQAPARGVRVGIDAFIAQLMGKIDRIHARPVGAQINQGDPMLSVEQNGRTLVLCAPISGEIEACNDQVIGRPERLSRRPYGEGWIYSLRPTLYLAEERRLLQTGQQARMWLQAEYRRLAAWLTAGHAVRVELAMQDGGLPAPGALEHLDASEWAEFQKEFLTLTAQKDR